MANISKIKSTSFSKALKEKIDLNDYKTSLKSVGNIEIPRQ